MIKTYTICGRIHTAVKVASCDGSKVTYFDKK